MLQGDQGKGGWHAQRQDLWLPGNSAFWKIWHLCEETLEADWHFQQYLAILGVGKAQPGGNGESYCQIQGNYWRLQKEETRFVGHKQQQVRQRLGGVQCGNLAPWLGSVKFHRQQLQPVQEYRVFAEIAKKIWVHN